MQVHTGGRLDVSVLRDAAAFGALEGEWDELYRHSPAASPFQSWAWLYSWWESYGKDYDLRLVAVRADGVLVGLLPMMLERGRAFRKLLFVGTGLTDYNDVLARGGWEARVAEAAQWALWGMGGWSVVELQELRPAAAAWGLFHGWRGPKRSFRQSVSPTLEVKPWDELLASVSKNLRAAARKTLRKIEEDGVRRQPAGSAGAENAAKRWVALHRESWQGRDISPEHMTAEFESHLVKAASRMVDRGLATITEFWRDEEVIISFLWVLGTDSIGVHLVGATQEALRRYTVSSLFVWDGVRIASERNSTYLDTLRGEEPYKLRWNPRMVPNHRVVLGRGRLFFGLYTGYRSLRATARGYARSEDTPRWLGTILNRLRGG
jgi:CelD/BcsL family acetyltransferase involved in cellulose biosynthesis